MAVVPMDGSRWEREVLGARGAVLVQFWRSTCPICAGLEPSVQRLGAELDGRMPLYRVDCDQEADLVWAYEVQSTPTFLVFCSGEALWRHAGEVAISEVRASALDALGRCAAGGAAPPAAP